MRRFPNNAEVLRLLGLADYAQGKTQEALDAFLKAIDADPDVESAYSSLEVLLPDVQQRRPEVIAKLRRFSERRPASPIGPFLLALLEPEKSEVLLRGAISVTSDFSGSKTKLASFRWSFSRAFLRRGRSALKVGKIPA